jgi:hypothetical protein
VVRILSSSLAKSYQDAQRFASPKWVRSARKEMMVEYSITYVRTKGSVKRRNSGEGQAKFILLLLAIPLA